MGQSGNLRRDVVQKILSPEPPHLYSPVVQWATVRLMLILQCIIGFQSQITDLMNSFDRAYIPSGEPVFIEHPRDIKRGGRQCDVVLRL